MSQVDVPFNIDNQILNINDIVNLLESHGVDNKPCDISLYRKAFVHRSYCTRKNDNFLSGNTSCPDNCIPLQEESNEVLEFLGDAVLNLVIADYLCQRYPQVTEGFLTVMRTKLVNGNMLANLSRKIGISKFLVISKQIEQNNGRDNKNILEDAFEALIGAIYSDFNKESGYDGFEVVSNFIITVYESYVEFSDIVQTNKNPKDILIKQCQSTFRR